MKLTNLLKAVAPPFCKINKSFESAPNFLDLALFISLTQTLYSINVRGLMNNKQFVLSVLCN